jgi:hypothetical protein
MRIAVKSDDELNGALSCAAAAAGSRDLGFPIGLLLVKTAKGLAAFGDGRPRLVGARHMGDKTAGWNRNLAPVGGLILGHAKATGLFSRGGKIRGALGSSVGRGPSEETGHEHSRKDETKTCPAHARDATTVSSLAATGVTA